MKSLEELKELMAKCINEMEICETKIAEAEGKEDAEGAKTAQELYDKHKKEFEGYEGKVAKAKEHKRMLDLQKEVEELAKPEKFEGKTFVEAKAAEAKDEDKESREKEKIFYDYVKGKTISDNARKELAPRSAKFEGEAADSIVMPERLALQVCGEQYAYAMGKTVYSFNNPLTNPSGGNNLVPPDFRAELLKLPYSMPSLFDRVRVVTTKAGTVTWPTLTQTDANSFGGVSFSWISEGANKPETEPTFSQVEIATNELAGYTEISERMLSRSAIQLEALLVELFRGAMAYTIDNAIINGSGTGQPLGIVNTAGIRTVARQTAGTVTDQDLVDLQFAVRPEYRGGCTYVAEDSVVQALANTADSFGRPLFRASTANGPYDRLIGYPYITSTNNPTVGVTGDVMYGNPREYILVMEEEITIARSKDYRFRQNVVAFKVFSVVGGRLVQPRAFAILEGAAS